MFFTLFTLLLATSPSLGIYDDEDVDESYFSNTRMNYQMPPPQVFPNAFTKILHSSNDTVCFGGNLAMYVKRGLSPAGTVMFNVELFNPKQWCILDLIARCLYGEQNQSVAMFPKTIIKTKKVDLNAEWITQLLTNLQPQTPMPQRRPVPYYPPYQFQQPQPPQAQYFPRF